MTSALVLLLAGLAAGFPMLQAQQASTALEQSALEWDLPAIDPTVAGRLAQLCAQRERGESAESERSEAALLADPKRLLEGLVSAHEHGAWRVPAERNAPPAVWRLNSVRLAVLDELAAQLPVTLVVERAGQTLIAEDLQDRRRAYLILLGAVARSRDVPLLIDLAAACSAEQISSDLQDALGRTLARNARGCREVESRWNQTPQALRLSVLRALADSGQAEALSVLAARLDDQPELTQSVLSLTGNLAARVQVVPDERVTWAVRARLDSMRVDVRREAALAAGRLEDAESVPRLVEMLESKEPGEREAAHWALKRISLLGLGPNPQPWKIWLVSEQEWWARDWPACRDGLRSTQAARVFASLDSIARRRLRRTELAAAVAASGEWGSAQYSERRCQVLGALRSKAGLAYLGMCMGSPDPALSAAASAAWLATTGQSDPTRASGSAHAPR